MKLETIRTSELQRAMRCELSYYYGKTRPEPPASAIMYIGTTVHRCLADYFLTILDGGNRADSEAQGRHVSG